MGGGRAGSKFVAVSTAAYLPTCLSQPTHHHSAANAVSGGTSTRRPERAQEISRRQGRKAAAWGERKPVTPRQNGICRHRPEVQSRQGLE